MFLILFHFCPFLQMSYQFVLRLCQKVRLDVLINLVLIKRNKSVRFTTFVFRLQLSGFSFRSFTSPDLVNTARSNFFVHNISVPRPACFTHQFSFVYLQANLSLILLCLGAVRYFCLHIKMCPSVYSNADHLRPAQLFHHSLTCC